MTDQHDTHLHIAIPAMDELEWLPKTLQAIADASDFHVSQNARLNFTVYVCVNQPDEWWKTSDKKRVCLENAKILQLLQNETRYPIEILDYSSPGKGWTGKDYGVGWARKMLFNKILETAAPTDLIVSMDADTAFHPNYLSSVLSTMAAHPEWVALSVPYYHRCTGNADMDKAMLHYEIYMRNYALNMLNIGSPYNFTALGSAIVVTAEALRKIGGITPMKSGEDFYLLQKLRKMGTVGTWNPECVFPATRTSDRVIFGTGPAIKHGKEGDWSSYPIYAHQHFAKIAQTYQLIERLYSENIETEFIGFLKQQFKQDDLWSSIRANTKNAKQFARAFHEKADGLRILQFLKTEQKRETKPDAQILRDNLKYFLTNEEWEKVASLFCSDKDLSHYSAAELSVIRETMFEKEMQIRSEQAKTGACRPDQRPRQ